MIIDQLPSLPSVQDTDEIAIERGTTTYKTPLSKLWTWLKTVFIVDASTSADTTWSSDKINTQLGGKQDTLTFDNVPTDSSNNPVKSGGVYDAIEEAKTLFESRTYSAWSLQTVGFSSTAGLQMTRTSPADAGGLRMLGFIVASVATHAEIFEIFITATGQITAFALTDTAKYNYVVNDNILTITSKSTTSRSVTAVLQVVSDSGAVVQFQAL